MNQFDTGEWEIWIDDVAGELAMEQTDMARRKISVVEAEVFEAIKQENKRLHTALSGLYVSIKLAPHVDQGAAIVYAEAVLGIDKFGLAGRPEPIITEGEK